VPGQIGLIQATEAIKLILKKGKPLIGKFMIYNAMDLDFRLFPVGKNPSCPLCSEKSKIKGLVDYHEVCSREAVSVPAG
jgi:adenylyltransferase/sulfurtransferase